VSAGGEMSDKVIDAVVGLGASGQPAEATFNGFVHR